MTEIRGRTGPAFNPARLLHLLLAALLGLALPAAAGAATDGNDAPVRIGVLTMTPGEEYWSRFGHNAIVVEDPARGLRLSYNYGYFDFDQPGFMRRFLRGQMQYQLVVLPLEQDLAIYAGEGRGVSLQWLDLDPEQARSIARHLEWNALPENASYRYDYFRSNCSTRVRDVLDQALEGDLARQMSSRSRGSTYRSESLRLGADVWWLWLGMHVGLSGAADRPLSLWEEGFVPGRLADALARATTPEGRPLVAQTVALVPDRLGLERGVAPKRRTGMALAGLLTAMLLLFLLRTRASSWQRLSGAVLAGGFWLLCGLGGLVLAGLWAFTEHLAAHGNENLLLLNPLCLGLLPAALVLLRRQAVPARLRALAGFVLAAAAFALFLRFLPFRPQSNGDFVALLMPIHAALAWRLMRR